MTGDKVDYRTAQEDGDRFPEIGAERYANAVYLVEPDGQVFGGAEAVLRTLALGGCCTLPWQTYQQSALVRKTAEAGYALVARNRMLFSRLTRLAWGESVLPSTYRESAWFVPRMLGLLATMIFIICAVREIMPFAFAAMGATSALLLTLGVSTRLMLLLATAFAVLLPGNDSTVLAYAWALLIPVALAGCILYGRWHFYDRYSTRRAPGGPAVMAMRLAVFAVTLTLAFQLVGMIRPITVETGTLPGVVCFLASAVLLLLPVLLWAPRRIRHGATLIMMLLTVMAIVVKAAPLLPGAMLLFLMLSQWDDRSLFWRSATEVSRAEADKQQ